MESCEKLLRAQLRDREFILDGSGARRYVMFSNRVVDRDAGELGNKHPEIRSSHSTRWALGDRPDWLPVLEATLAQAETDSATLNADTCGMLDVVARCIPSLWFIHDVTGSGKMHCTC